MKSFLFLLLFSPLLVFGQVTSPSLISNSGDSYSNNNVNMDFSIGEIVIETHQNNEILTQGFHQEILQISTGISELDLVTKVYPNPTSDFVIVELENDNTGEILIYDINGKLMLSDKLNNERKKQFDFSKFSQGNYLLHINIKDKRDIYKIQKIK
ncbi:MAG: T9SS type A sorting domain-containing protein [Bacteroidota bacterium]|nr:T9SS type A sorting domain-containing protein [Bacteroidota bacterium]